ncbi:N-acetylmannosamine kinase [Devosia sp. XK-2]|uniref:N-acetylmannosamine kinase n=1 Tax=Devosia sp. XK-2 TaxID=3126689 RepID=UPI0030D49EF5
MTETSEHPVLAIDIGGTKVALAIVVSGQVTHRVQIATPRSGRGTDIVEAIAGQATLLPRTTAAGVATTGIVDHGHLTALNPATLPIEDRFPLVEALGQRLSRPILAINDAQAAAWAEYCIGAGQGAARMIFVTVSTGIGAGLVLDGRLQSGARGLAGHVGHMVSDAAGPTCGCGRRGCVERVASGSAVGMLATEMLGRPVAAPEVFAAAEAGDERCANLLDRASAALANTLCDLVASLDLDRIVLGGGVGLAEGFLQRVKMSMETLPAVYRRPIVKAGTGADAGLLGVAALVNGGNFH